MASADDKELPPAFCTAYGSKLLITIFCTHHMLKGFAGGGGQSGLVGAAMEFTFRNLQIDGPSLQVLLAVATLPWSMKAIMGLMSDGFPLCGRRKAPYLFLSTLVAVAAYVALGGGFVVGKEACTASFFAVFFQMALADLLVEAKYSEKVKAVPERGPDLITFVWGGIAIFTLVSTVVAGWVLEHMGPRVCYSAALPFAALLLWPVGCNYLEEVRPPEVRACRPDAEVWRGKGRVPFGLAMVSGVAAIGMAGASLALSSVRSKFYVAAFVGLLNLVLFSFFLRPVIAKINAFFFLQSVFHIGTHGAAFYFFTDTESQYARGPHFSRQFYVTGIGSVAAIFQLVGMFLYNSIMKKWRYRTILMGSSIAYALVNCLSVIAYKRINLDYGMSDKPFLLASSAMQSAIGQFSWMPMTVMLAQLVPQGIESVMYALLAGSLNLGSAVANYAGALVLESLGVTPNGAQDEDAKFDNLWIAALISACGPCVPLILVNFLVPDARQTDRLLDDGDPGSATTGSLFEKCFAIAARRWDKRYRAMESTSATRSSDAVGDDGIEMANATPRALGKLSDAL